MTASTCRIRAAGGRVGVASADDKAARSARRVTSVSSSAPNVRCDSARTWSGASSSARSQPRQQLHPGQEAGRVVAPDGGGEEQPVHVGGPDGDIHPALSRSPDPVRADGVVNLMEAVDRPSGIEHQVSGCHRVDGKRPANLCCLGCHASTGVRRLRLRTRPVPRLLPTGGCKVDERRRNGRVRVESTRGDHAVYRPRLMPATAPRRSVSGQRPPGIPAISDELPRMGAQTGSHARETGNSTPQQRRHQPDPYPQEQRPPLPRD